VSISDIPDDIRVWEMLAKMEKSAGSVFTVRVRDTDAHLLKLLAMPDAFLFGDALLFPGNGAPKPYQLSVSNIRCAANALIFKHAVRVHVDYNENCVLLLDADTNAHVATVVKTRQTPAQVLARDTALTHAQAFGTGAGIFASAGAVFAFKAMVTSPFLDDGGDVGSWYARAAEDDLIVSRCDSTIMAASAKALQQERRAYEMKLTVARSVATRVAAFPECGIHFEAGVGPFQGRAVGKRLQLFLTPLALLTFNHFFPSWLSKGRDDDGAFPPGFVASAAFYLPYTDATNVSRDLPECLQDVWLHEVRFTDIDEATALRVLTH
jgi:hypothetical protein